MKCKAGTEAQKEYMQYIYKINDTPARKQKLKKTEINYNTTTSFYLIIL